MYSSAFVFGLLAGLSIGPIAILILNLAITRGPQAAVLAGIGAALGDFVWGTAAFLGGAALSAALAGQEGLFKALCSAMLMAIAGWMLRSAVVRLRAGAVPDAASAGRAADRYGPLLGTLALTCANPLTAVVFVGFMARIDGPITAADACGMGLMVFAGSLTVQLMIASAGSALRNLARSPTRVFAMNVACLAALVGYAIDGLL